MSAKYSYQTRDARFVLKEWLPLEQIFAYPRYEGWSKDDIDGLLEQVNRMIRDKIAPTNDDGEKNHPRLENGRVVGPPSYKEAFAYFQQNGWGTSNIDERGEGTMPEVVYAALTEMCCAASPAFVYYPGLTTGAAKCIQSYASPELKVKFLPGLMDGRFQGCMCITEPGAGTDVGDGITRAIPTDEIGVYRLKGSKIFISVGDGNHVQNFIYLTLARIQGSASGTRGLSLFIIPRFWINEDGSWSDNDVVTTGIEDKFGIRGCPTVSLSFGDNGACRGYLIGEPPGENGAGQGLIQMFQMMNGKRLECGTTSAGVAANEYWNAAAYSRERIQGRLLASSGSDRVALINHEDVKRMLLRNKATTEVIRSLVMKAYFYMDISEQDPDNERRHWAASRLQCLTPLCKAYSSDEAWSLIEESIQTYGGYGFTEEYPAARAVRDTKINSIYEGTNYIQSMDLITRKWTLQQGQAFAGMLNDIKEFINNEQSKWPELEVEFAGLKRALDDYYFIQGTVASWFKTGKPGLAAGYARRILTATGQLFGSYYLLEQAVIAAGHLREIASSHYDYHFYLGKTISARFFIRQILPQVGLIRQLVAAGDDTLVDCPPEIFNY
ncbi:MAG: acyl-CoA dehydrogenase [Methylocystaceae bacterium]